ILPHEGMEPVQGFEVHISFDGPGWNVKDIEARIVRSKSSDGSELHAEGVRISRFRYHVARGDCPVLCIGTILDEQGIESCRVGNGRRGGLEVRTVLETVPRDGIGPRPS